MSTATTLPADKFDTDMTFTRPSDPVQRVALDKMAVLPGFNTRVKDAEYQDRVAGIAESIVANGFFDDKPFAVVMIEGDDTVYIYDGEHRFDAAKQAGLDGAEFPDGLPVAWAKDGATVKDLTIHLAHGNNGERLNMVELAAVVRRMQGLGMDKPEIATALGRTTRHIDNLFVLADSNQTIKKAVAGGEIAGAEAVKLIRKHGSKDAATKITEAVKAAKERGKAKATPKSMAKKPSGPKTKTVNMSMEFTAGATMGDMLKAMAGEIREFVEFDKSSDEIETAATVKFSVTTIDREAEAAKAEAEKAKAEAAAKREAEKAEKKKAAAKKKADAAKKKAEQDKMLAEAKAKGSDAKAKPAPKKAPAKKPAASKGKTPAKGKAATPAKAPQKPAEADSTAAAPTTPENPVSSPSGSETAADDGMGGL